MGQNHSGSALQQLERRDVVVAVAQRQQQLVVAASDRLDLRQRTGAEHTDPWRSDRSRAVFLRLLGEQIEIDSARRRQLLGKPKAVVGYPRRRRWQRRHKGDPWPLAFTGHSRL